MVRCGPVGVKDLILRRRIRRRGFEKRSTFLTRMKFADAVAMADGIDVAPSGGRVRGPGFWCVRTLWAPENPEGGARVLAYRRVAAAFSRADVPRDDCPHSQKLVEQRVLGDACLAGRSRGRMKHLQPSTSTPTDLYPTGP
jgi:hypothetical protein